MELWIRSQDKTNLLKIDNINIDNNKYSLYYQLSYAQIKLGEYKTKERALDVLDEIQCHLVNINDSRHGYFHVYEMPIN